MLPESANTLAIYPKNAFWNGTVRFSDHNVFPISFNKDIDRA